MFSPQTESLMSVVEKISREAKSGALISIESTIPKGTSKKVFEKLDPRLHVVHAPHRWYALEEDVHGVNQLRIIGGVSSCCLQHGLQFYHGDILLDRSISTTLGKNKVDNTPTTAEFISKVQSVLEKFEVLVSPSLSIPIHPVSSVEVAELTKIIENAHRYLRLGHNSF